MAKTILFTILFSFLMSSYTHVQAKEQEGFISINISNKGLDFVKDLLINKSISSLIPLQLPQLHKSVEIPVVGKVDITLSNITIDGVDVSSSIIKPGGTGIAIVVSGATVNLSMEWNYAYTTWLLPFDVSDKGSAFVQVEDMEVGLTLALKNKQGALNLSILECGCYVEDISIKLKGGASWLYQGLVDAFEWNIASAIEDAVSKKTRDGITKLDSVLQSLPKEVPVDNIGALNVTFLNDPVLSNSFVDLEIDGLFIERDKIAIANHHPNYLQASVSCEDPDKMVGISLHENVLNSALLLYFHADLMHWTVDKTPDQPLLNTAGWKHIVPQLYKQYPNDDMDLNISVSSPPIIEVENQSIHVTIQSDVTLDVLDAGDVIPVACISLVIRASGSAEISRNTLTGSITLNNFSVSLKWSKIGKLHMYLIQLVMSAIVETIIFPYVNLQLWNGFPLPVFDGYTLQNTRIINTDSRIVICSDVEAIKQYNFYQPFVR